MTVEPIGLVALLIGLISLVVEPAFVVYAFFASTLLGAAAAFILVALGGATIQPAHLLLGFLAVKLLAMRDVRAGALRAVSFGKPGFWLLVTAVYVVVTAYLLPRLFEGQTSAFSVRAVGDNYAVRLAPNTANLTQSVYFVGDFICFLVLSGFGSSEAGRTSLARAAVMCIILNLGFAVLDMVTYATGTGELLSFIRNSTYSMMSDTEMAGFKRVVGSFVEASSFGYWTLGYFAYATSLWLNGISARFTFVLMVLSFFALICSTSTTAYAGLTGYLLVEFLIVGARFLTGTVRPQMLVFLVCAPMLLALVVIMICLNDVTYAYVKDLLDTIVLNKMSTGSGIERSSWNSQAFQNFLDTFGFGVGNGSVRASSFPIAVIASLGILGAGMYASFLITIWTRRVKIAPPDVLATQRAARAACVAWLIAASVSGGFIDLGLPFFAFAALACVRPSEARTQAMEVKAHALPAFNEA
jgi:O-Antigen ligase